MGRRVLGLVLCSVGSGMLLVIIVPGWGFLVAGILVAIGICMLCSRC